MRWPPPQLRVHGNSSVVFVLSVYEPHGLTGAITQLMAHLCSLHALVCFVSPHWAPLPDADCVTERARVWMPAPHALSHAPSMPL